MRKVFRKQTTDEGEIFNKWLESRLIKQNKNVLSAELGSTGCLFWETIVAGQTRTLKDLYCSNKKIIDTISITKPVNKNGCYYPKKSKSEIIDSGIKGVYEIELENGKKVITTSEHKFFKQKGNNFVEEILSNLKVGDLIRDYPPNYCKIYFDKAKDSEQVRRDNKLYTTKIKSIKYIGKAQTFDLYTPEYHNFVLENGILTHNSGKSYRDLRKAELWYKYHFKKDFPIEHICFGIPSIMKLLASGKLVKGDLIIGEEAGVNLGSREWQSKFSKMFNYVLQSFRSMNIGILFNLPYLSMLDTQARHLLHYYGESAGIDVERKKNKCKPFFLQVAQSTGKIYRHYPSVKMNGRVVKIKRFNYSLPSQYLIDAYEKKKAQYLKDMIKDYSDKTNTEKKDPRKENLQLKVELYRDEGYSLREIAKKTGITTPTVMRYLKDRRVLTPNV